MGENIRLPAIDSLYSKGRHHNINIICVDHTVTDLNTKSRDNTPAIYILLSIVQINSLKEYKRSLKLILIYIDLYIISMA